MKRRPTSSYFFALLFAAFAAQGAEGIPLALTVAIRCTNTVVKAGDEIAIEFLITNRGTIDYPYADRTYDRSGRMPEYKLTARNAAGEGVPDPRSREGFGFWNGGGLFQPAVLKPGQSFTRTIPLNRWALVKEPGVYEVTGFYPAPAYSTNDAGAVVSQPIRLTVLPRTVEEMDAYITALTNRLARESEREAKTETLMKLMYTCSPKTVPVLLDSMYQPDSGGFWVTEALLYYIPRTAETRKAILQAVAEHGMGKNLGYMVAHYGFPDEEIKPIIVRALAPENPGNWAAGADLAQQYGNDAFNARLIAIATDPKSGARANAITALAQNRTDEGVKTLKALCDDPDPATWTPVALAILNAGISRHESTGRPLRPEDFTAKDVKPLIERMLSSEKQNPDVIFGVSLVQQFADDASAGRLIVIAKDSNHTARSQAIYALALNRTVEGVKMLKTLLADPDPKVRATTEEAIRHAYDFAGGNSRGTPLKPGDFDEKFRQGK